MRSMQFQEAWSPSRATARVALTLKSAPRGLWPPATLQRTSFRMLRRTNIVIRLTPITMRKTVPGS